MKILNNRRAEVREEKRKILDRSFAKGQTRISILIEVFNLCIDNLDKNNLEDKLPSLYAELLRIYNLYNDDALTIEDKKQLWAVFDMYKESLRIIDINLYYALLGFVDTLK